MRRRFLRCWLAVLVGAGCGDDDKSKPVELPDLPELTITGVQPVGGVLRSPGEGCFELGRDADQTLYVMVGPTAEDQPGQLQGFTLRPPGSCGGTPQCGHVLLRVDPASGSEALQVRAASVAIGVPMGGVDVPVGTHTIRVALVDDEGAAILDDDERPIWTAVTLELAAFGQCGASDPGGDAGAAGLAGRAGAGGGPPTIPAAGTAGLSGAAGAAGSTVTNLGGGSGEGPAAGGETGSGGSAGEIGSGGSAGETGSGGSAGEIGSGGSAGEIGSGGSAGEIGSGGRTESGGGAAGMAGSSAGTAGSSAGAGAGGASAGTAGSVVSTAGASGAAALAGAAGSAGSAGWAGAGGVPTAGHGGVGGA